MDQQWHEQKLMVWKYYYGQMLIVLVHERTCLWGETRVEGKEF